MGEKIVKNFKKRSNFGEQSPTAKGVGGDRKIQRGGGSTLSQISRFLHDFLGQNEVML